MIHFDLTPNFVLLFFLPIYRLNMVLSREILCVFELYLENKWHFLQKSMETSGGLERLKKQVGDAGVCAFYHLG